MPLDTARWKIDRIRNEQWRFCLESDYGTQIILWQYRYSKKACEDDIALVRSVVHVAPILYTEGE